MGHPSLFAGTTIKLVGFGTFDGVFFVKTVNHKVGSGGYTTSAEIRKTIGAKDIDVKIVHRVETQEYIQTYAPTDIVDYVNNYQQWEENFNKVYADLYKRKLTEKEELLLCLPKIAEAEAKNAKNAVDAQGWNYLKAMFQKWFSGSANAKADNNPEPFWIDWDWVMSFSHAQTAYENFSDHNAINSLPGYPYYTGPNILNMAAQKSLGNILQRDGFLTGQNAIFNFSTSSWQEWQSTFHTERSVEREWEMNGLFVALAGFSLRAIADGTIWRTNTKHSITVSTSSVFAFDRFGFGRRGFDPLGNWDCKNKKSYPLASLSSELIYDSDFINFRNKYGAGSDFLVLSKPHQVENFTGWSYVYP